MKNTLMDARVTKKGRREVDARAGNVRLDQVETFGQSPDLEAWFPHANVRVEARKID